MNEYIYQSHQPVREWLSVTVALVTLLAYAVMRPVLAAIDAVAGDRHISAGPEVRR